MVTLKTWWMGRGAQSRMESSLNNSPRSHSEWQFFIIAFEKIAFIVPDHHKKFDFQSSTSETLALFTSFCTTLSSCFLWSSNATPTALSYFSYHLIIIAVCTIASFSVFRGGSGENEMELKSRTSKRLFDHVLSVFSPSPRPCLQLSPPRSFRVPF